jgi:hypothetical protein
MSRGRSHHAKHAQGSRKFNLGNSDDRDDHRSEKREMCQLQWAHWKITLQNSSPKILMSDFWNKKSPTKSSTSSTNIRRRFRSRGTFRTERMPIATTTKSKMFQPQRREVLADWPLMGHGSRGC